MIVGKNAALKGFSLFFYAIVTILALIGLVNLGHFWSVVGIINAVVNAVVIVKLYNYWSNLNNK